ncbi:uncharacterized protein F5147DRAFT_756903 [Suillus discolor]|uniref:Uncharacterized protein n=1 Tax=Suillus discolor TaxID=1912936 RepID=A0A9P7K0T2_9AGAM|nr:uncharacterized protein F5147DRAFT_756903 [Suillus discolor]KAG2119527.1 hypothetical protein F5147DRAFT_756903 [Suillus discolor]
MKADGTVVGYEEADIVQLHATNAALRAYDDNKIMLPQGVSIASYYQLKFEDDDDQEHSVATHIINYNKRCLYTMSAVIKLFLGHNRDPSDINVSTSALYILSPHPCHGRFRCRLSMGWPMTCRSSRKYHLHATGAHLKACCTYFPPLPAPPTPLTSLFTLSALPIPDNMLAAEILLPEPNASFPETFIYTSNRNDPHSEGDTIAIFSLTAGEARACERGGVEGGGVEVFERIDGGTRTSSRVRYRISPRSPITGTRYCGCLVCFNTITAESVIVEGRITKKRRTGEYILNIIFWCTILSFIIHSSSILEMSN